MKENIWMDRALSLWLLMMVLAAVDVLGLWAEGSSLTDGIEEQSSNLLRLCFYFSFAAASNVRHGLLP